LGIDNKANTWLITEVKLQENHVIRSTVAGGMPGSLLDIDNVIQEAFTRIKSEKSNLR
jgi:hypothetical protein